MRRAYTGIAALQTVDRKRSWRRPPATTSTLMIKAIALAYCWRGMLENGTTPQSQRSLRPEDQRVLCRPRAAAAAAPPRRVMNSRRRTTLSIIR
jgi:hypothetical protein